MFYENMKTTVSHFSSAALIKHARLEKKYDIFISRLTSEQRIYICIGRRKLIVFGPKMNVKMVIEGHHPLSIILH